MGYKSRYVQMENKERLTCLSYRRFPIPHEQILRFYGEQLCCVKVAAFDFCNRIHAPGVLRSDVESKLRARLLFTFNKTPTLRKCF